MKGKRNRYPLQKTELVDWFDAILMVMGCFGKVILWVFTLSNRHFYTSFSSSFLAYLCPVAFEVLRFFTGNK